MADSTMFHRITQKIFIKVSQVHNNLTLSFFSNINDHELFINFTNIGILNKQELLVVDVSTKLS